MRKDQTNKTITLDFTNVVIKGVLKAKIIEDNSPKEGWIRIDDIHIKEIKDLPFTIDMIEWQPFIKQYIDFPISIQEYQGLILEIYENYEGYLYFAYDLIIGDIANEEYEDIYGGNHFD